ncbi:MAG: membrane dipeptidase [Deltaproteobacteria bacterium]|nr:membrane dipeptidase [Deltaproteobacteria bacterium]
MTFSASTFAGVGACGNTHYSDEVLRIHQSSLVVDGHNDLPWGLRTHADMDLTKFNLDTVQNNFHTDMVRLRQGGMGAQFWSAYVPMSQPQASAVKMTFEQMDLIERMAKKYSSTLQLALSTKDIRQARLKGKIASLIGVEGGHSINNSLETLTKLYAKGARYMTLTHSKNLDWIESATDSPMSQPLNAFGESVVREMNALGMLVDISHVSARAMRSVLQVSTSPVIASHSSAYSVTQHPRNVPDDVLQTIASNGGVVMVNFYNRYIEHGGRVNVATLVDHIDHIVKVAGIDHVGLGSDYDGVELVPDGLEDVSCYPSITEELLKRHYSESDIRKILGENLMRAFQKVEELISTKS